MKVTIISYIHHQKILNAVKYYFQEIGAEPQIFLSDFIHKKGHLTEDKKENNIVYIHADSYEKNVSIKRMTSYLKWSRAAFAEIQKNKPDIIFLVLPPNSLFKQMIKYKAANPNTKVIAYIMDLWPESLPVSAGKERLLKPILNIWRKYRNKYLQTADLIFTECDYYKEILKEQGIDTKNFVTLHLFGDEIREDIDYIPSDDLRFLYLGSINNIIDIDRIIKLLVELNRKKQVQLNIIGDGERKDELIRQAQLNGIETIFHGKIYDDEYKQKIMNNCDFGLNIYKENLAIGLTIKSIDYFRGGLPIINTIEGDTAILIKKEEIGLNLKDINITAEEILKLENYILYRHNAIESYKKHFTREIFLDKISILQEFISNESANNNCII